jgi:hypothetical protein
MQYCPSGLVTLDPMGNVSEQFEYKVLTFGLKRRVPPRDFEKQSQAHSLSHEMKRMKHRMGEYFHIQSRDERRPYLRYFHLTYTSTVYASKPATSWECVPFQDHA